MPRADVGVVGAGLAGLTAAVGLAEAGARVHVLAMGHAASHWSAGGIDAGTVAGGATPRDAIERLARVPGHPYGFLAGAVPEALDWLRATLAREGITLVGELADPIVAIPTAIGATRPAAILPDSMAAALAPWQPGERLVVCGPAGFRDFWPEAIAASLRREGAWRGATRPAEIEAVVVDLPGLAGRRNLSGLDLARAFDDPRWRDAAFEAMAQALDRAGRRPGRVALPAVLGLDDHATALAVARERLPLPPFEVALVPPSVPGIRMYRALRAALVRHGGRVQVGEAVHGSIGPDRRVAELRSPAATREFVVSVGSVVLATGGIAGGGIVGDQDVALTETVLGLPVDDPTSGTWLLGDPFDPAGHPLETAGIRTDRELRPVRPGTSDPPLAENVRVVGSLLAGQRYLRERCGDGVAIASGRLAAASLGPGIAAAPGADRRPAPAAAGRGAP